MKNREAIKMLTAKVECIRRETSGTDIDCNLRNCDDCKLCYAQGTTGEQREALNMAISALQAQEAKAQLSAEVTTSDCISRQEAIDYCYALINAENIDDSADEWNYSQERVNQTEVILHHLEFMPSAQPEPQLIPVELRNNSPEENKVVLLGVRFRDDFKYFVTSRQDYNYWIGLGREIKGELKWQPLPEPYRAERRTDDLQ